jgi:hypothetical protein
MNANYSFLRIFKPAIPKRYLLFVAAFVWTFAGGMLLTRGFLLLVLFPRLLWVKIICSLTSGIVFFVLLFSKVSQKHTQRILNMEMEYPCAFSFFSFRSYVMMALMISMGITLRKTAIVPLEYLSLFYVAMGMPLLMSAFRFYYNGINYKKVVGRVA